MKKIKEVQLFSEINKFSHNQDQLDNKQSLFNIGEDVRSKQIETAISVLIKWRGVRTLVYRPSNPRKQPRKGYSDTDVYGLETAAKDAYGPYSEKFVPSDDNYDFEATVLIHQDQSVVFDVNAVSFIENQGYILSDFDFIPNDIIKVLRRDLMGRFFLVTKKEQFGTTQSVFHKYFITNYSV